MTLWQDHWDEGPLWRGDAAAVGAWSLLDEPPTAHTKAGVDVTPPARVAGAAANDDVDDELPFALADDDDFDTGEVTAPTRPGITSDAALVAHLHARERRPLRAAALGLFVVAGLGALAMGLQQRVEPTPALVAQEVAQRLAPPPVAVLVQAAPPARSLGPPTADVPMVGRKTTAKGVAEAMATAPPKAIPSLTAALPIESKPVPPPTMKQPVATTTIAAPAPAPLTSAGRAVAILDVSGDDTAGAQRLIGSSLRTALQQAGFSIGDAAASGWGLKLRISKIVVTEGAESSADVRCDAAVIQLPGHQLRGSTRGEAEARGEVPSDELVSDAVVACAQQVVEGVSAQLNR